MRDVQPSPVQVPAARFQSARFQGARFLSFSSEPLLELCDPLVLFEEPPDHIRDKQAGDPRTVDWPRLSRPTWP